MCVGVFGVCLEFYFDFVKCGVVFVGEKMFVVKGEVSVFGIVCVCNIVDLSVDCYIVCW